MIQQYSLLVEGDLIPYWWIEVDEKGIPYDKSTEQFKTLLDNFVTVIDVTDLPYDPVSNSHWDGTSFSQELGFTDVPSELLGLTRIAFLDKENNLLGMMASSDEFNEMYIAAFLSNAKVVVETIDHDE